MRPPPARKMKSESKDEKFKLRERGFHVLLTLNSLIYYTTTISPSPVFILFVWVGVTKENDDCLKRNIRLGQ